MYNSNIINYRGPQTHRDDRTKPPPTSNAAPSYRSSAGDLANMPPEKGKFVPSIAHTIDTVLDTTPARQTLRPLAKLRPSWIGPAPPERPRTPGVEAMKQLINVQYASPGLQPPVYVFTNLSEPQWDAIEMQADKQSNGEYKFSRYFSAEEGEYQYKFRLGPGDWWTYDESKPTVDDGMGNKNNLVMVKSEIAPSTHSKGDHPEPVAQVSSFSRSVIGASSKSAIDIPTLRIPASVQQPANKIGDVPAATSPELHTAIAAPASPGSKPLPISLPKSTIELPSVKTPAAEEHQPLAPLLKHETFAPPKGAESQQTPEREKQDPFVQDDDPDAGPKNAVTSTANNDDYANSDSDADDEGYVHSPPLLRHESLGLHSLEQEQAPLFRHESISRGNNRHDMDSIATTPLRSPRIVHSPAIPQEADHNDPNLEKFPSGYADIVNLIHSVKAKLPEDETTHHSIHDSPLSQVLSNSTMSPMSLASVRESDEDDEDMEEMEKIREAEEEEYEREVSDGEEMDPLAKDHSASADEDPEDADFQPKTERIEPVIVIEKTVIVEVVKELSALDNLLESLRSNAVALALGALVVVVGVASLRFKSA